VYDPCCGSSGMFVQSVEFIHAHASGSGNAGKVRADISIYGQESNYTTWRLAKMNLAIRGIEGQIAHGDSFHNDRHPDLKADYILANPPFNVSDWRGELLKGDKRWKYGIPPPGNANFAWVQHMIHHLAPTGVAGFILASNSLTSATGGEDLIRKGLVDADLVDCIVTLPDRLFYTTPIPASIWILRRGRRSDALTGLRNRAILFIDASACGKAVTRTNRELTDTDIRRIAQAYRSWLDGLQNHSDRLGFCRSVPVQSVVANSYNLLPAAYVNAGHVQALHGPRLHDLIMGEASGAASSALGHVAALASTFKEAIEHLAAQTGELERGIIFETRMLGELLERSDERLGGDEEPEVLTCTESGGLILQRERFAKRVATEDTRKYKIVRMGDIVYNPYLLWKGAIDQCWIVETGITSPAYEVLRVREGFDKTILGQLVTSREMVKRYDGISFGTVQRRRRAPVEKFLEFKVNVPSGDHLAVLSALLSCSQSCQFAARNSERAVRQFIADLCTRLR